MIKRIFFLLILISFFQNPLSAQNSNQVSDSASEQTEQTLSDENQHPDSNSAPASQISNWNWSETNTDQTQNQPSTIGLFFKMIFALAIVVLLAYVALKILKKSTTIANSDDPFLRHVSHLALNSNRSVDVVTILDHAYILGVSDNAVNLVGEITDKELVDSMNLYADKNDNTKRPRTFNDILSIFMPNSTTNKKESIYGSSGFNASEMLRRQRERLNENEEGGE